MPNTGVSIHQIHAGVSEEILTKIVKDYEWRTSPIGYIVQVLTYLLVIGIAIIVAVFALKGNVDNGETQITKLTTQVQSLQTQNMALSTSLNATNTQLELVQIRGGVPKAPTVQIFTSGNGTYITPLGAIYVRVRLVGGGGGGAGSTTVLSPGYDGSNGQNSTFGVNLLVGTGGGGGLGPGSPVDIGGTGGNGIIGNGLIGIKVQGNAGTTVYGITAPVSGLSGGMGGTSPFGGLSPSTIIQIPATINSGSGGSGGAITQTGWAGAGGGAGGYVDVIITSPTSTYPYSVGNGGAGGISGSNGHPGSGGGSGIIVVEEYYQ